MLVGRSDLAEMAVEAARSATEHRGAAAAAAPFQAPSVLDTAGPAMRAEGGDGCGLRGGAPLTPMWQPQLRTPAPGLPASHS
jgi:hypothetical protein